MGKSIFDKIKEAVVESDEPPAQAPHVAPTQPFPNISSQAPVYTPMAPQYTPPADVATPMSSGATGQSGSAGQVDPEALKVVKAAVYVSSLSGRQSNFILFTNMWEALGRPADPQMVLRALKVNGPALTPSDILRDIDQHSALLDNTVAAGKASFDEMLAEQVGQNDTEMKSLEEATERANQEIQRHTRENAERAQRVTVLTAERERAKTNAQKGWFKTQAAANVVKSEIQSMKQLFQGATS